MKPPTLPLEGHRLLEDKYELNLALLEKVVVWLTTDPRWVFEQSKGHYIGGSIYEERPEAYWVPNNWLPSLSTINQYNRQERAKQNA